MIFIKQFNLLLILFYGIIICSILEFRCAQANASVNTTPITDFAIKFSDNLDKSKNVISSPLSAQYLMALLTLGSTEPAHSELLMALGYTDDNSIRSSFSTVTTKLQSLPGVTLNVANKVYIRDGPYELQPQFKENAVKIFNADIEKVNFGDSGPTVRAINQWVEHKTNNKITDLLSEDSVDAFTSLVLVNAIYFKGTWKKPFDPLKTNQYLFHIDVNTTVPVSMMYNDGEYFAYRYSRELQAELLELPYDGNDTRMLIVLPFKTKSLNEILATLAGGYDLMSEVNKMHTSELEVLIPKFKIETEIDLKVLLPKLGIKSIFDSNNSGLTKLLNGDTPLYVSKATQKAFIEVNEEGTEAAAATGLEMRPVSLPRPFYANRPFFYMIHSGRGDQRIVLFTGSYRGVA